MLLPTIVAATMAAGSSANERWLADVAEINAGRLGNSRRAVHIEIGANDGLFSKHALKRVCVGGPARPVAARHLFVIVEPQQQFRDQLVNLTKKYSGTICQVLFVNACAWTRDGNITFSVRRDSRSAHIGAEPPTRRSKGSPGSPTTTMPTIDFAVFMNRHVVASDFVFVKVDVEVAEFTLLPHLLTHGALCNVDLMFIEWHFSRIYNHAARLGALGLRLSLVEQLERGCPARPGARRRFVQHDELQLSRHHVVPGLYERARWHNGLPPIDNRTGAMIWAGSAAIQAQARYSQDIMEASGKMPATTSSDE